MADNVDFSRNAAVYDRRHGAFLSLEATASLFQLAALSSHSRVLDIAAGTGRVAIPLARHCRVVAIDVSHAMLTSLLAKAGATVPVLVADANALPFPAETFDAVIFARVLYLLPEWRQSLLAALRILRPEGILLHEWGNGTADEPWVQIREKARELFEAAGITSPFHPGVRTEAEVTAFLTQHGVVPQTDVAFEPDVRMTLGTFVERIGNGECSYTWKLPPDVQQACLPKLVEWARDHFDFESPVATPMRQGDGQRVSETEEGAGHGGRRVAGADQSVYQGI